MSEYLTLGAVLLLSIAGHNMTVVYAAVIVLAVKIFAQVSGSSIILDYLGSHGLNFGIIILTAAILVPIANGTVTISTMIDSFKTPIGIVAVTAGLLAAISGGRSFNAGKSQRYPRAYRGNNGGSFFLQRNCRRSFNCGGLYVFCYGVVATFQVKF